MYLVVLEAGAALAEKHVYWNEELKQTYHQPRRDLVRRPEQEESIEHIQKPKTFTVI